MSSQALDDRTFENAVDLSPEEQAANASHFEAKGYDTEVVPEEGEGTPPASAPTEETKPTDTAVAKPDDSAAPVVEDDPSLDAELQAEAAAKPDGQKLGTYARRTRKIHELKATVSEKERENAELRAKLAAKTAETATPSPFVAPKAVVPEPAKKEPEPAAEIKPKEFEEERPKVPQLADFADEEDPYAALAVATAGFAEKLLDWKDRKRDFDDNQKVETARLKREVEEQRTRETTRQESSANKLREVVQAHPDFETVTQGAKYSPVVRYLLLEELPDGYELGYQLGLPEHADTLKSLTEKTQDAKTPQEIQSAIYEAVADLAVFRKELKAKAQAPPPETTPEPDPKPNPPAVVPPRREEAAPQPVKGRAAATARPEDVDPMDSDARRALRHANR